MNRIGWLLGRFAANVVAMAGFDSRLNVREQNVLIELFKVRLEKLPTAYYCCEDDCDGECVATDTPGEAKDWWKRD